MFARERLYFRTPPHMRRPMSDLNAPQLYRYRLSGLCVASPFALPMRSLVAGEGAGAPDVIFRLGDIPPGLGEVTHRGASWTANAQTCLLELPGIGRFLAEGGKCLTVSPAPGVPLDDILVFVTGTAFAAILYQRGALLLHGSAVVHHDHAYVFCAPSGTGKSTLAGALVEAGAAFLADDVCAIEQTADHVRVRADGRCLRLYRDSIDHVGLHAGVGQRVRQRLDKFHVAIDQPGRSPMDTAPLGAIYILSNSNASSPPGIARMPSLMAAQALLHETYRRRLALAYSSQSCLATAVATLLSRVPVYHFRRPRDFDLLSESVAMVHAHWAEQVLTGDG